MSDPFDSAIVIPVGLQVFPVTKKVKDEHVNRWEMNYGHRDPEAQQEQKTDLKFQVGVYVHWILPPFFFEIKEGRQAPPPIPNRWLVTRCIVKSGENKIENRSWLVKSDAVHENESVEINSTVSGASFPVLHDKAEHNGRTKKLRIGKKEALGTENIWLDEEENLFFKDNPLNAFSTGNPAFLAYQPHCNDVTSLYDDMAGVSKNSKISYSVVGWYSKANIDIAKEGSGNREKHKKWLQDIDLISEGEIPLNVNRSLFQGRMTGLTWRPGEEMAKPPVDTAGAEAGKETYQKLRVSVGQTSIDSLVGLMKMQPRFSEEQSGELKGKLNNSELFRAFCYDLLDELDAPAGRQKVDQAIREARFNPHEGGTRWQVDYSEDRPQEYHLTAEQIAQENAWVKALNDDQTQYDNLIERYKSEFATLKKSWLKSGVFSTMSSFSQKRYLRSKLGLDKSKWGVNERGKQDVFKLFEDKIKKSSSVIKKLKTPLSNVLTRLPNIFGGNDDIEEKIKAYAISKGIDRYRTLKVLSKSRYWQAQEPTIALTGMNIDKETRLERNCRYVGNIGHDFEFDKTTYQSNSALLFTVHSNAPSSINKLVNEIHLFDPSTQKVPEAPDDLHNWLSARKQHFKSMKVKKSWSPVYIDWKLDWFNIPMTSKIFDGVDYKQNGEYETKKNNVVSGRSYITNNMDEFVLNKISSYLETENSNVKEKLSQWNIMIQPLSGLNEKLALQEQPAFCYKKNNVLKSRENQEVLISEREFSEMSDIDPATSNFQEQIRDFTGLRNAVWRFRELKVYDAFGYSEVIVSPVGPFRKYDHARPIREENQIPDTTRSFSNIFNYISSSPRLLQPARIEYKLNHAVNKLNPVGGWMLCNHLEKGITFYNPDGVVVGSLQAFDESVEWLDSPVGSTEMTSDYQSLNFIINFLKTKSKASFEEFCRIIDSTLWNSDPLGGRDDQQLSVLVGRPLAILDVDLCLRLKGRAIEDPRWQVTFPEEAIDKEKATPKTILDEFRAKAAKDSDKPAEPEIPVRLGSSTNGNDGLLGYFKELDEGKLKEGKKIESVFNYVSDNIDIVDRETHKLIKENNFLNIPMNSAGDNKKAKLLAIVDPRAPVFVESGLLPPKPVSVPEEWVNQALNAIKSSFRVGPVLNHFNPAKGDDEGKIILTEHLPSLSKGQFKWRYQNKEEWKVAEISNSEINKPESASLQDGYLELSHFSGEN